MFSRQVLSPCRAAGQPGRLPWRGRLGTAAAHGPLRHLRGPGPDGGGCRAPDQHAARRVHLASAPGQTLSASGAAAGSSARAADAGRPSRVRDRRARATAPRRHPAYRVRAAPRAPLRARRHRWADNCTMRRDGPTAGFAGTPTLILRKPRTPVISISIGGALHSVASTLVDERVWARADGAELVVVHADSADGPREVARHALTTPGRPSIDHAHYPPCAAGALERRPRAASADEEAFLASVRAATSTEIRDNDSGSEDA